MFGPARLILVCAIAVLLQVLVAPLINLGGFYPSFIVPLVIALAILREADTMYIAAFVLGFIADLFTSSPIGLTPLLLLMVTFVLSRAFEMLDKESRVMPLITIVVASFVIQLISTIVLGLLGYGSIGDLFLTRVLLGSLINGIVGIAWYFIGLKVGLSQTVNNAWSIPVASRFR